MKLRLTLKKTAVAIALAVASTTVTAPAQASIQGTMESIFNSMTNTSQPGVYEGIRRGVLSGGSLNIHNRIVDANILSLALPDWRAGCGGIDFFGGAFSFINAEQLVQLARAVAANAAGYAFFLAIDAISTSINLNIKEMLAKIQEWVGLLSNSCEIAMVALDGVTDDKHGHYAAFMRRLEQAGVKAGTSQDNHAAKVLDDIVGTTKSLAEAKAMKGNIVYRSMVEQETASWFSGGGMDAIEEMMSLLGTIIVSDDAPKTDEKGNLRVDYKSSVLDFKDLVNGGKNLSVYQCNNYEKDKDKLDDACTQITPDKNRTIIALKERFETILLGSEYATTRKVGGLVLKIHGPNGNSLTPNERNLMSNMGAYAIPIQTLSARNPEYAAVFVKQMLPALTVEILYHMTQQLNKATREAVMQSQSPYASDALLAMEKNERKIVAEVEALQTEYGTVADMFRLYLDFLAALPESSDDQLSSNATELNTNSPGQAPEK